MAGLEASFFLVFLSVVVVYKERLSIPNSIYRHRSVYPMERYVLLIGDLGSVAVGFCTSVSPKYSGSIFVAGCEAMYCICWP